MRRFTFMKLLVVCLAFAMLFTATAVPRAASAQSIGISVSFGPPAIPYYVQPPAPGPNYIWTPGYWAYDPGNGYYWVPGTWVLAPQYGLLWTPGYWGWNGVAFAFTSGFWGAQVGWYGGVDYGYGYYGHGYDGGRWQGRNFVYNVAVTNVNRTYVHNVYRDPGVVQHTWNRTSYNGGHGGVALRPDLCSARGAEPSGVRSDQRAGAALALRRDEPGELRRPKPRSSRHPGDDAPDPTRLRPGAAPGTAATCGPATARRRPAARCTAARRAHRCSTPTWRRSITPLRKSTMPRRKRTLHQRSSTTPRRKHAAPVQHAAPQVHAAPPQQHYAAPQHAAPVQHAAAPQAHAAPQQHAPQQPAQGAGTNTTGSCHIVIRASRGTATILTSSAATPPRIAAVIAVPRLRSG